MPTYLPDVQIEIPKFSRELAILHETIKSVSGRIKQLTNDYYGYNYCIRAYKARKRSIYNNKHPLRTKKCKHGRTQRTRTKDTK